MVTQEDIDTGWRFTTSVKYTIEELKKFWRYGSRPGESEYTRLLINRLRECNVIE